MTLFDLVFRSMRKNIKHYYLYFFALIFSVILYFVFATLEHDPSVIERSGGSMGSAFKAAGILLLFIAGIFIIYANAIFLRRRSREIGLYQLIGLTKGAVARLLIIENTLLSTGALALGIGAGMLVSRVFLLLLMKLIGAGGFITLTFSAAAIMQTLLVFLLMIVLTSIQMLIAVYRSTLLGLFTADKAGEHPKTPKALRSAYLAIAGIGLIIFGYWLSGRMINERLFFNMIAVLASTILGTYLLFRVTISWLFYQIRKRKQGHLGLYSSLSIGSLMHRMKGNANSLTIITVLSAMTLTMLAGAYSLYYSTEKETRLMYPHDFMFDSFEGIGKEKAEAENFAQLLEEQGIGYQLTPIDIVEVYGGFEESTGLGKWLRESFGASVINVNQLQQAGIDVETPDTGTAVFYDATVSWMMKSVKVPFTFHLGNEESKSELSITAVGEGNVLNSFSSGTQVVVNEDTYKELENQFASIDDTTRKQTSYSVNITDQSEIAEASRIYQKARNEDFRWDYYSQYKVGMERSGLLIFIAGFLGLVFLISTGSILYFKQMTEAEQEKKSYATLRQLGFTVSDIMHGIIRKQVFVFGLPLLIGLLHSIFAIKAASFLFQSAITVPAAIAMGVYGMIYLIFAFLTVGYYRKTVKEAL